MPETSTSANQVFDLELRIKSPLCVGTRFPRKIIYNGHFLLKVMDNTPNKVIEGIFLLKDLPHQVALESTTFYLQGAVAFRGPASARRNVLGHYLGYVRRASGVWEVHDDLKYKMETFGKIWSM